MYSDWGCCRLRKPWRCPSTYALLFNSTQAFGSKPPLTFLRTANPEDSPIRWSQAELLAALANVPLAGADISSVRYCRTGPAPPARQVGRAL